MTLMGTFAEGESVGDTPVVHNRVHQGASVDAHEEARRVEDGQPVVHVIDHCQSENHCEEHDLRHCSSNPKLIIYIDAQGNRHQTRRQASVDPASQGRAFSSHSCAPCTSTLVCRRFCCRARHQTIPAKGARSGLRECLSWQPSSPTIFLKDARKMRADIAGAHTALSKAFDSG
jgi:hypothetical protein